MYLNADHSDLQRVSVFLAEEFVFLGEERLTFQSFVAHLSKEKRTLLSQQHCELSNCIKWNSFQIQKRFCPIFFLQCPNPPPPPTSSNAKKTSLWTRRNLEQTLVYMEGPSWVKEEGKGQWGGSDGMGGGGFRHFCHLSMSPFRLARICRQFDPKLSAPLLS